MKRNKFGAKKTVAFGITFDSAAESHRWCVLKVLEDIGDINCLQRQVPFILAPSVKIAGEKRARPAIRFYADFTYQQKGRLVVEDVKSPVTARLPAFRLKQHLMATVHGLEIRLTA